MTPSRTSRSSSAVPATGPQHPATAPRPHEVATEAGQYQVLGTVLAARALVGALRGDVDGARRDGIDGLQLCERHGDRFWEIHNRAALGLLELSLGDIGSAHPYLSPLPDLAP